MITHGKAHEVNVLDDLFIEAGAIYIMDRGYLDFARLYRIQTSSAFFVIRAKSNFRFQRIHSLPIEEETGIECDQIVTLKNFYTKKDFPERLRRIRYFDATTNKHLVFLTNNFQLPAQTIAQLYRCRWQVELFFKWIKQHLRIKAFYGTSENAVNTQIWIAVSVYVLVAILKKRLHLEESLYKILQVLSVTLFEKIPIEQVFADNDENIPKIETHNKLNLFS